MAKKMDPVWDEYLVQRMNDLQQLEDLAQPTQLETPANQPSVLKPDAPKRAPIGLKRFERSPTKKFPKRKLEYDEEDDQCETKRRVSSEGDEVRTRSDPKKEGVTHVVEFVKHDFSKKMCFLIQSFDKQTNEILSRETFGPNKIPKYLSRVMKANPTKCKEIASKMFNLLSKYTF